MLTLKPSLKTSEANRYRRLLFANQIAATIEVVRGKPIRPMGGVLRPNPFHDAAGRFEALTVVDMGNLVHADSLPALTAGFKCLQDFLPATPYHL